MEELIFAVLIFLAIYFTGLYTDNPYFYFLCMMGIFGGIMTVSLSYITRG